MNCLEQQKINSYLAGEGTAETRDKIETHLANCAECRLNLTQNYAENPEEFFPAPKYLKEKAKLLPKKGKQTEPFFSFLFTRQTAFAMASFVVLFSFIGFWVWSNDSGGTGDDVLRQGEQTAESLKLLTPQINAELSGKEIEFGWEKQANANSYVLIVSDEKGDIVFQKQTREQNLNVKTSEAKLIPGKQYFWYVRAKSIDGKISETSPQKFTFKN